MAPPPAECFAPPLPDELVCRILDCLGDDARARCTAACVARDWRRLARASMCLRWILHGEQHDGYKWAAQLLTDDAFGALALRAAAALPPGALMDQVNLRLCQSLTLPGALRALQAAGLRDRVRRLHVLGLRALDAGGAALAGALRELVAPNGWVDVLWCAEFWNSEQPTLLWLCGRGTPPCDRLCVAASAACMVCKAMEAHPRPLRLGPADASRVGDEERARRLGAPCVVEGCTRAATTACRGCCAVFCSSCADLNLFGRAACSAKHVRNCKNYGDEHSCTLFCSQCVAKGQHLVHCTNEGCSEHYARTCFRFEIPVRNDMRTSSYETFYKCGDCGKLTCTALHCENNDFYDDFYAYRACNRSFCLTCACGAKQPGCSRLATCAMCKHHVCSNGASYKHGLACATCRTFFCNECFQNSRVLRRCDNDPDFCGKAWCAQCEEGHFPNAAHGNNDNRCDTCIACGEGAERFEPRFFLDSPDDDDFDEGVHLDPDDLYFDELP